MSKILFVFAGTGLGATGIHNDYESEPFNDDVVRVYFNGCQDRNIGGAALPGIGIISPNLDTVGSKLRTCFDNNANLSLDTLKAQFGQSIIIEPQDIESKVEVDSINLTGFSRGGVTTFAAARHLDDLGKPINIYAEDPVPGNSKSSAKKNSSEFYKNHDLRNCTNIKHAEVSLGVYKNNVNRLHNKFFRQMAPLFSTNCDASVYVVPKTHHLHYSRKAENQTKQFLVNCGLITGPTFYNESKDRMTFTPKVIQQKNHIGIIGRIEISPRYKKQLHNIVKKNHKIRSSQSVKITQALYALDIGPASDSKQTLYQTVKKDTTPKGKAIREFLVEFEAINSYALRRSKSKTTEKAINNYRTKIYEQLSSFPIENSTPEQQKKFSDVMLINLRSIKDKIPNSEYKELSTLTNSFLKDNVIFHLDQTQYLDETETCRKKTATLKDGDSAMVSVKTARDGNELAEVLYNLSDNSREAAYKRFSKNLHEVIQDVQQLEKVIRFLPAKDITSILKNPSLKKYIKDMGDLNSLINKLPYADQKLAVFNTMKNNINELKPTYKQIGEMMQHLPIAECKSLLKTQVLSQIHANSTEAMIQIFEQLDQKKFDKLLPVIAKDIKQYLFVTITFKQYLEKRAATNDSKKSINVIFSGNSSAISAQEMMKSELRSLKEELILNLTSLTGTKKI